MRRIWGLMAGLFWVLSACRAATPALPASSAMAEPSLMAEPSPRRLIVLYTSDEHGWMEATKSSGGAAGLAGIWRDKEGCVPGGDCLILSGGDMWTGPAISTWFKGQPMVEAMNAMGYVGAAVGNHEFDFGLDVLRVRAAQMNFPLLAANLIERDTGQPPDWVRPYQLVEMNDVQVGLIGLALTDTPLVTQPRYVAGLEFQPYEAVLRRVVPQVREAGAQVLVVVSHLCPDEMRALAPAAAELGIAVIGGGHCHARMGQVVNGVALIEASSNLEVYARVEIVLDATGRVMDVRASTHGNVGGAADETVAGIVQNWRRQADAALSQPIGYVQNEIAQRSPEMLNMLLDSWLAAYPADVALCNRGSFRQSIPAGPITRETIIGMLPFDNVLVEVQLSGKQLIDNMDCCNPAIAGISRAEIDPQATYRVLVNDFMYGGGDGYRLKEYDPDAYHTGIDWRQPLVDWLASLQTTAGQPLDDHLNRQAR